MDEAKLRRLLELTQRIRELESRHSIYNFFPDEDRPGFHARTKYAKHQEFFALGAVKPLRLFIGANGVGKSESCGGYELVLHLTGLYPYWWEGKRYDRPIYAWAAGDTNETLRESMQPKLIGKVGAAGTGLIPPECIGDIRYRPNTNGTIDNMLVRHVSGGWSRLVLKSYEQRREAFQAADVDLIWLDEEPDAEIFSECVQRFRGATSGGHVLLTFTPLRGISEVVSMFIPAFASQYDEASYEASGRAFVMCSWDDVPHLTEQEKAQKLANCLPLEREARSKGIPSIGQGRIYVTPESDFIIPPLESGIPRQWPRVFGLDVGWNRTAAVFGAIDQDTNTIYLYSEHYMGEAHPSVHAAALRARGSWIPGVVDPASRGRSQIDGKALIDLYRDLGLELHAADNEVSTGLFSVEERLSQGRLKVYNSLTNWLREYRLYRRDDKGKVVKSDDHLMDATRYLCQSGIKHATTQQRHEIQIPKLRFG